MEDAYLNMKSLPTKTRRWQSVITQEGRAAGCPKNITHGLHDIGSCRWKAAAVKCKLI